jgi:hypothetical protein
LSMWRTACCCIMASMLTRLPIQPPFPLDDRGYIFAAHRPPARSQWLIILQPIRGVASDPVVPSWVMLPTASALLGSATASTARRQSAIAGTTTPAAWASLPHRSLWTAAKVVAWMAIPQGGPPLRQSGWERRGGLVGRPRYRGHARLRPT